MGKLICLAVLCAVLTCVSPLASAQEIVVDKLIKIPPLKEEVVTPQPSLDEIWVPGYWEREPGTWTKGRWEKPPHKLAHWISGHWQWNDDKWRWNPGYWATDDTDWFVEDIIDMPPIVEETKPLKTEDKSFWIPGHWDWDGSWLWIPGYFTEKPNPKAVWVPGSWMPYENDGGFWWMGGHWVVK